MPGIRCVAPDRAAGEKVQIRARFTDVETAGTDYAFLSGGDGASLGLAGRVSGSLGMTQSGWVDVPADGLVQLRFGATNANGSSNGLTVAGFDYRRFQSGANAVWTHLGFPGQYYDPETDLFENWHRYYDASTGRYLEPDSIWRDPESVRGSLNAGYLPPVFAYSLNNPMGATDPTGEHWVPQDSGGAAWVAGLKSAAPEVYNLIEQDPRDVTVHSDGRVPPSPDNGYLGMESMPSQVSAITSAPYVVLPSSGIPIPADAVADISVNPKAEDGTNAENADAKVHEVFHVLVIMGKVVVVKVPECRSEHECEEAQAEGFARAVVHDWKTASPYFIRLDREKFFQMGKAIHDRLFDIGWVGSEDVENRGGGSF